ncbi:MAG TPA: maleylpyruvate isomerase N-terminal domain-containing protein [Mycobacteriales bacterium]|nr:maleylpyruvate isomerase N-terminal domain-containing protein [Mycobacteriales bacterium]
MLVCPVDNETLSSCEATAVARNVELLQRVAADTRLLTGTWTAHDTAAHLVTMAGRYLNANRELAGSQRELREMNQREIEEFASATMGELVGRLRSRNAKYAVFWPDQPLDAPFPYRTGFPLDAATLRSNWITELLIHGRDVALASGEQWSLDDTSCLLALRVLAQVLPRYVTAAAPTDYALVIAPDGGLPFSIVMKEGVAEIHNGAVEGGDRLSGPPAALVLLFYGRVGLADARQMGAAVSGDAGGVERFLNSLDKP